MDGIQLLDLPQAAFGEIEGGQFAYIVTPDGRPFKVDIAQLVGKMQQDAGCLCVQTAKLDIPSAEVLTLNTTPKAFGLNVPAGYYAQILGVTFRMIFNATAYDTNTTLNVSGAALANVLGIGANVNNLSILNNLSNVNVTAGGDVTVTVQDGDPLNGDSDITVYLTYVLVPL